jgi:hypothetical protein
VLLLAGGHDTNRLLRHFFSETHLQREMGMLLVTTFGFSTNIKFENLSVLSYHLTVELRCNAVTTTGIRVEIHVSSW